MPRRELLTSSERLELLTFPDDEGELIRLYTLTKEDLTFVRQQTLRRCSWELLMNEVTGK
jgi:hypothetical protein